MSSKSDFLGGKMTRSNNLYIILIIQALLSILLFISESYVMCGTIIIFCLMDLVILVSLMRRKWSYPELFTFSTFFASLMFLMFYIFLQGTLTTILGIVAMLLFLVAALLMYGENTEVPKQLVELAKPVKPKTIQTYDITEFEKELDELGKDAKLQPRAPAATVLESAIDRSRSKETKEKEAREKARAQARAIAYELEREAAELKRAESYVHRKESENQQQELVREATELENAEKLLGTEHLRLSEQELEKETLDLENAEKTMLSRQRQSQLMEFVREAADMERVQKLIASKKLQSQKMELEKEAAELAKADKYIEAQKLRSKEQKLIKQAQDIENADKIVRAKNRQLKKKELGREVKKLSQAQNQINQLQFLNKQEKIIAQAKQLAKVQKQMDDISKKQKDKPVAKKVNITEKSMFVATETGNRFHEPGCMALKRVPKNKLVLFVSKKDAMKKGYQPCDVCKP